jgi:hypothetical protein
VEEVLVPMLVTLPEVEVEDWDEMEGVRAVPTFEVPLDDDDAAVEADVDDALFAPMEKDALVA